MSTELAVVGGGWGFVLGELRAEGGSSQVWHGQRADGVAAALKLGRSGAERARFANEAERLVLASSTGLPQVFDVGLLPPAERAELGLPKQVPFIAMEWLPGAAIDARALTDSERVELALVVARDIGEALSDLHQVGIAHGDLKPRNIVLDRAARRARLVDLGLSELLHARHVQGATPRYLAPECRASGPLADAGARDLWALGLTLAEIGSRRVAESADPGKEAHDVRFEPRLEGILRPLLRAAAGARPGAEWVSRAAARAIGGDLNAHARRERVESSVRRAYLALRNPELSRVARGGVVRLEVAGLAERWLRPTMKLLERVATLRASADGPSALPPKPHVLSDLTALGQSQLVTKLLGPGGGRRLVKGFDSDAALLEHVAAAILQQEPRSARGLVLAAAERTLVPAEDAVALALALSEQEPGDRVVDAAELYVEQHPEALSLGLALARTLRLREELGRALAVLDKLDHPAASVEAAEVARRAGDDALALRRLAALEPTCTPEVLARAAATRARLALKAGDLEAAERALATAPESPATLEAEALLLLRRNELARAEARLLKARPLVLHAEELARLEFLHARIAHARHDYQAALDGFARAAEYAVRAGAVLEEATYLSGVAAAATELGCLSQALEAAERAWLLYGYLARPEQAARAALSRANVYLVVGAKEEAIEAAGEALRLARQTGDRMCQAYAHFAHAEAMAADADTALEHLTCAERLLGAERSQADTLRLGTLGLRLGQSDALGTHDALASERTLSAEARLDWWGARAERALKLRSQDGVDAILLELASLAGAHAAVGVRGPAYAAGAELAARAGDGERARRFARLAADAAATLDQTVPATLRTSLGERPWMQPRKRVQEARVSPEQIRDVETLVRSLTSDAGLRPLLNQVLDALVLWTGVERGLLLLCAPGGKLVPRAARNLARADLKGPQLDLSHSLALRALETREAVIAVDAQGELPEHHESVHALKLRSLLCIPLFFRGETLGVVYLDDRVRTGAFGPEELSWVQLVASIAAVAIGDARDQLKLKRALRRAERAEHKLGAALEHSEARRDVAERELSSHTRARSTRFAYDEIIGRSPALAKLLALVDRVTLADVPVLIFGESGSGKELVARAIHYNGTRKREPFVSENCAAIPEPLLESTLFGHVRGAFTGASRARPGLFNVAHGGTLFLDEIGEMSLGMQAKLLRVIETGDVRPVGSEQSRHVDVRVVGATQRDLEAMVQAGSFRQDLLFRLNVVSLRVPALRERREDILPLMQHFLAKYRPERPPTLSRLAAERLEAYEWPGNVRELENEARRALVMAEELILPDHLSPRVQGQAAPGVGQSELNVRQRIDRLETELVTTALERTAGNQTRAAELLGLSRFGLQKMMKRLQIAREPMSSV